MLLGRRIRLDLESLQVKLVRARRGGYCFEQTTLFAAVLETLGFAPIRHTARVVLIAPRTQSPRTHMCLTVRLAEGTFVVDPGFGALAPFDPVRLVDAVKADDGTTHWMAHDGAHWTLRTRQDGKIVDCWVTSFEHNNTIDFEVGNHYTATHPDSPFVNRLMLRALTPEGRVTVMNRDVTFRDASGVRTTQLAARGALRTLLSERFGIDLPEADTLRVPSIPEWG